MFHDKIVRGERAVRATQLDLDNARTRLAVAHADLKKLRSFSRVPTEELDEAEAELRTRVLRKFNHS